MRILVVRAFELLMGVVAALAVYEIAAIGYGLSTGDMGLTITHIVTQQTWSAVLAAAAALAFGVGLAIHFAIERRDRERGK